MNDEPWGRAPDPLLLHPFLPTEFESDSAALPSSPSPQSRLRSRVVVDRILVTPLSSRFLLVAPMVREKVTGGSSEIFWKFSKEESREGVSLKESRGKFLARSVEISKNLITVRLL